MSSRSVCLFDQFSDIGGGQKVAYDVASFLKKNNTRIVVFAIGKGLLSKLLEKENISFIELPKLDLTNGKKGIKDVILILWWSIKSLILTFKDLNIKESTLLYCNGPRTLLLVLLLSTIKKKKFIIHYHLEQKDMFSKTLIKLANKHRLHCANIAISNFIQKTNSLSEKNILIHNWVTNDIFQQGKNILQNKIGSLNMSTKKVNVCYIGRISSKKGPDILLKALLKLDRNLLDKLEINIVGDVGHEKQESDYYKTLIEYTNQNDLRAIVNFNGSTLNILDVYKIADIVVIPSQWEEPFGLVAVESMATGCVTIVTNSGALPEIIKHEYSGFIFEKNDIQELADILVNCIYKKYDLLSIINNARKTVEEKFNPDIQLNKIMDICLR